MENCNYFMYLLDCMNLFLLTFISVLCLKGDFISHNALVIMQSIWPLFKNISVALCKLKCVNGLHNFELIVMQCDFRTNSQCFTIKLALD